VIDLAFGRELRPGCGEAYHAPRTLMSVSSPKQKN
jgi:hypothetical protein